MGSISRLCSQVRASSRRPAILGNRRTTCEKRHKLSGDSQRQSLTTEASTTSSMAQRRLAQLVKELTPAPPIVGTLKLGDITYEVPTAATPSRLARSTVLLDINDPVNLDNLHFMLQKYLLGQDIFLVSQPGPYARRLALTFAR